MKKTGFFLLLTGLLAVSACKNDDCKPGEDCHVHDQELITKLQLDFSDSMSGQWVASYTFDDPDGAGGNAPSIDTIRMAVGSSYLVALRVFAFHTDHTDEITAEILAEASEHLFCFTPSVANLQIQRTDTDGTFEIGLASRWHAQTAGLGSVRVTLKHQPNSTKDGTCLPGDTDIEVDFPVMVQ